MRTGDYYVFKAKTVIVAAGGASHIFKPRAVGEGMGREEYYGLKKDELPYNIHHTLGSPRFRLYQDTEYADLWKNNFKDLMKRPFDEIRDTIYHK